MAFEESESKSGTRPADSKGKWHRVGYDDTVCNRYYIKGDWAYLPIEEIPIDQLCKTCWPNKTKRLTGRPS